MKWERYTFKIIDNKKYVVDKLIFTLSILFLLCTFLLFVFLNGGLSNDKNIYIYCETENNQPYCFNPLYREYPTCNNLWAGACDERFLYNGFTYGTPPPKWFLMFDIIILMVLVSAFIVNHFVYNKGFNRK